MLNRSHTWHEALSDLVWTRYVNLLINVPLSLRFRPFKSQVSAATGALFISNAQCGTAFFLVYAKDVKIMGQRSLSCPLYSAVYHPKWSLNTCLHTVQLQNWLLHHPSYWVQKDVMLSGFEHWKFWTGTLQHIDHGRISCSVYAWSLFLTVSFMCVGWVECS